MGNNSISQAGKPYEMNATLYDENGDKLWSGNGSVMPNNKTVINGNVVHREENMVQPGSYRGEVTKMNSSGRIAIFFHTTTNSKGDLGAPTTPGSPKSVATGLFVHCGYKPNDNGSDACLTVDPTGDEDCSGFTDNLSQGECVDIVNYGPAGYEKIY